MPTYMVGHADCPPREIKVSVSEILCCQISRSRLLKLWGGVEFSGFECVVAASVRTLTA